MKNYFPPAIEASRGVYWNQAQKKFTHPYTEYPWVSVSLSLCHSFTLWPLLTTIRRGPWDLPHKFHFYLIIICRKIKQFKVGPVLSWSSAKMRGCDKNQSITLTHTIALYSLINFQTAYKITSQPSILAERRIGKTQLYNTKYVLSTISHYQMPLYFGIV